MHLKIGEVSTIVVLTPEAAKAVMKSHDTIFAYRPCLLAPNIISYGAAGIAFAPYGDYWRQMRKSCTLELLNTKQVELFQSIREEQVSNLISHISSNVGSVVNLGEKIFSLTYGITARVAFGGKCHDQQTVIIAVKEGIEATGGFDAADVFPSIKLLQVISGMRPKLAKTQVLVNAWAIGRDPTCWTEPERFYPERFLGSQVDYKGLNFEYIPFGAGRRICPGIAFAMPNVEPPLAQLLYHFVWKFPDESEREDLEMIESFGVMVWRKKELCLIPTPYFQPNI